MRNRREADSAEYQVCDAAALRQVMGSLIARHRGELRLARATGISQPYLNKLRNAKPKSVGRPVLERLLRICTPAERTALDSAFTSPAARALYRRYVAWLVRELRAYGLGLEDPALTGTVSGLSDWRPPPSLSPRRRAKAAQLDLLPHVLSILRQRHPDVFRKALGPVEQQWANTPDGRWRVYLALLRVASPLLAASQTGDIERSFQDLEKAGQLRDYLKHALAAQAILLRREVALVRARQSRRGV